MTRYLISFPSGAMDHIPAEEFPAVGEAAHAVVGREDRGRLPLCSRDPRVHARPGGGQLNEAQRGRFAPTARTEPIAWASVLSPDYLTVCDT